MGLKVDMIYGDTGSTKTSRLGDAIEYYTKRTGKPAQGVFTDTGGYESIAGLVDEGRLIPYLLTFERGDTLIEDLDKLSKGWWPADPHDPKSKLVYGKLDNVCLRVFDGVTTQCQMMLTFHETAVKYVSTSDSIIATTVRVPEMPKDSFVRSGDYVRRFTGRSDYGGVQGRIKEFIRNSAMLPVPAIWTALETKGSDEQKKPIYGPDFIGQALTGICGPWFGNLLHLDLLATAGEESVGGKSIKIIRAEPFLFTRPHIDPDDPSKIPYGAKARADKRLWQKVPAVMEPRLDKFYELLDRLAEEAKGMGSPLTQPTKGAS